MGYNKVIFLGNLTRDVELRYLPSGMAVATIGIASNRKYKKQDGSQGDDVCFIDAKLFGRTAEIANQYLRKGSKLLVEGRLNYETWTDQQGVKKSRHIITAESIQMLDSKQEGQQAQGNPQGYAPQGNPQGYAPQGNPQGGYAQQNVPQGNPQGNPQGYAPQGNPQGGYVPQGGYEQNIPEINIDDEDIPF